MANVKIVGDALVLTSSIKFEDLKLVEKRYPRALSLYTEENGREVEDFSVRTTSGQGVITEYGVTFGKASREGGYAQITMGIPEVDGDVKEAVVDIIGIPLMKLNNLEALLPDVIAQIAEQKEQMLDCIEVC